MRVFEFNHFFPEHDRLRERSDRVTGFCCFYFLFLGQLEYANGIQILKEPEQNILKSQSDGGNPHAIANLFKLIVTLCFFPVFIQQTQRLRFK